MRNQAVRPAELAFLSRHAPAHLERGLSLGDHFVKHDDPRSVEIVVTEDDHGQVAKPEVSSNDLCGTVAEQAGRRRCAGTRA